MVALRKESVDRNIQNLVLWYIDWASLSARRAWIEICPVRRKKIGRLSLSARRAWIEIVEFHLYAASGVVALRKESVDRNSMAAVCQIVSSKSLSARRAWIEIPR